MFGDNSRKRAGATKDERKAQRACADSSELGFKIGAGALAAVLCGFAFAEAARNDGSPKINGLSHFAVFAQPARLRDERLARAQAPTKGVDYTPTAAIRPDAEGVRGIVVERDGVRYEGPDGAAIARIGDSVPGRGRVVAIIGRAGGWRAIYLADGAAQTSR